jgi:MerR family mercuric resistance operon transcriptional regulator
MTAEQMTIARFAEAADVGVETVRFYQRRGLLSVPRAGRSGWREYDTGMLRRLRFIRRAQAAGFTLEEIKELLRLDGSRARRRVQEMARHRLDELHRRIAELQDAARSLHQLLHACEHALGGASCPIIESFTSGNGDRH